MKSIKKSIALTLSILCFLPVTACKKGMADRDGNMWEYSLKEAQDEEGYFIRVEKEGKTVYQPLLDPSKAGYVSSGKSQRFILMCNKDKLIPVLTGNNLLVYIDDDKKIPESFYLEKYADCGYTFGGMFKSSDKETGLRLASGGNSSSFVSGSSMNARWSGKKNRDLYILDNIGGWAIGSLNIDENGVFQNLDPGREYEFSCFVGTKYETVTVMADTHYYKAEQTYRLYQKDCISLTTNGFAIITIPKIESGYYVLNNSYMFYYDAENISGTPISEQFDYVDTTTMTSKTETTAPSETLNSKLIGNDDEDYELPGDSAPATTQPISNEDE